MTNPIKQALKALKNAAPCHNVGGTVRTDMDAAIAALEGLEKVEPVAWVPVIQGVKHRPVDSKFQADELRAIGAEIIPLYRHPAPVQAEPAAQSNQLSGNSGELNLIARAEQAEPVAWLVYAGILDMRPVYPAYNTKELAESAAACIKSNTEVRPLYLAPPAAPAKLEPLTLAEVDAVREKLRGTEYDIYGYTRAIEAAHNAKLGGK